MRILQVMHDVPYPPRGGGRVDMWGRLRTLAELGHQVDVLVAAWREPEEEIVANIRLYAHRAMFCPRRPMWRGLIGRRPCQISSRAALASIELPNSYDLVLLEGDAVGVILDNPTLKSTYRVVRTHNWESRYHQERSRISSSGAVMKCYDRIEARRYASYSVRLLERCDAVWWVSVDELEDARAVNFSPRPKSLWLPHFHDVAHMTPYAPAPNRTVLFVGTLSFAQNVEAVTWYLENIHPRLVRVQGYRFVVAGGTDNRRLPPNLDALGKAPKTQLMTDVPDLTSVYSSARIFANPVQHGAGINSKTIHALSRGLPIVTTTPGYRGTGLRSGVHLMAQDEPDAFARDVRAILEGAVNDEEMVKEAQQFLADHYDQKACLESLLRSLVEGTQDTGERHRNSLG